MPHPILKNYRRNLWMLMSVYVALMLLVFPLARHADGNVLKTVYAMLCVSPVIAVVWLMAARIWHSDELEQRLHLMALSVATGVVAVASLIGGFLHSVHVISVDGDILIWVFPALCMTYGLSRVLLARRYGGSGCEE
ncbi:MAG TPA: hypothetical protein VGH80_02955 [Xanthomonadaceae bacterium]